MYCVVSRHRIIDILTSIINTKLALFILMSVCLLSCLKDGGLSTSLYTFFEDVSKTIREKGFLIWTL